MMSSGTPVISQEEKMRRDHERAFQELVELINIDVARVSEAEAPELWTRVKKLVSFFQKELRPIRKAARQLKKKTSTYVLKTKGPKRVHRTQTGQRLEMREVETKLAFQKWQMPYIMNCIASYALHHSIVKSPDEARYLAEDMGNFIDANRPTTRTMRMVSAPPLKNEHGFDFSSASFEISMNTPDAFARAEENKAGMLPFQPMGDGGDGGGGGGGNPNAPPVSKNMEDAD